MLIHKRKERTDIKLLKKFGVFGVVFLLVSSYFIPLIGYAETAKEVEITSAQMITDENDKTNINIELNLLNQTEQPLQREIQLKNAQFMDTAVIEKDGYSYQVTNGTLYLTLDAQVKKPVQLSLAVEQSSLQTAQPPKLLYENNEYDVSVTSEKITVEDSAKESTEPEKITVPENTKETNKNDSAPEKTEQPTATEEVTNPFAEARMAPATLRANLALPLIAPQYTTDNSGTYPTANWQPTGNQNVLNHQGNKDGGAQWDGQTSWNGDPTNRKNSYIEYGGTGDQADYAIRKYARETATPGLFDVYLNVRGNVQKEITPLDLVLVVDWSGSMNENNRIGEVQKGVNRFVDTLADSGITNNINMGYVGYSSDGYNNNAIQMGPFDTVKNPIKNITPSSTRGGTFTQKALRDAGDMLATPNGHKKVIVLLTDGVPTFSYKVSRVQTEADGRFYGTQFTNRQDQPGSTSYISGSYNALDQNNINKRINSTFIATIGEAMALKQRGIEIHGLGIQLQSDPRANLSKQQVEDKMREMVSADENGDLYYESADYAPDISDYLAKKAVQISGTVVNGKVVDPIAEPFKYEPNTLSMKSVGPVQVQTLPEVSLTGATINSNEIYLGKGQEIQIHYQVRIQTESENFKPDFWYQMNGQTTFQPLATAPEKVDFGVPSGKAPGVKLNVKKIWEEYDQDPISRPDNVIYEISRKQITDTANWQTGYIKLSKPENDTSNSWERKNVTQLSKTADESYQEVLGLPQYNNQGQAFNYQTTRELAVPGYSQEKIDDTTWKNTKQFKPLDLKVIKNSSSGEKNLVGAVFELSGKNVQTTLVDNKDGSYSLPKDVRLQKGERYILTEVKAPTGHELGKKTTWQIEVNEQGKVSIDGQEVTTTNQVIPLEIENKFSSLPIRIRKYTMQNGKQVNLAEATFALQRKNAQGSYQTVATQKTDTAGLSYFKISEPGEYRMVEQSGPLGYDTLAGNYEFTVDKYGEIHYAGKNIEENAPEWTLTHQNHLKPFDLTVHKKADNQTPLKGAKFRLTGPDTDIELPKDGKETDTFVFENLKPGKYVLTETFTPEGYQGLKEPIELIIREDGSVTIDGEKVADVLISGEKNNQITLDVTNQAKVPLPETGGIGRLWFYLIAISTFVIAGVYLFIRRPEGSV
ncbi:endocarditis and biofilm-associated pilus tip protein EbpA [Enterococcus faecalis]|uniref:endocarditis and biofilm-associated pilus tip protein EbpA n=1 Tax=Enterococcus faecalis TaxID=1351 RepID=UPI00128E3017|nr:endocarditis and biofilm-associated pilus tip protein EbpA [Enterococcus faecalis]EHQ2601513.1 endocarditis and biofilm-associated pilus tip protein EbpA [Enterococcus faecalis]EIP8441646.1 endocarditis and biofilm-associated pilus tip protein EbpA [Enterococcus faecalis]EKI7425703.1 endocarditis and biofilm-associated pilus tip protein EbpA [Enterococcus faecalis]EKJ5004678.1 endocarditis and biofilm-associated pilus tip protein EbpA [Enterococcus faecalis]EKZ0190554.1 endocarditis and bio